MYAFGQRVVAIDVHDLKAVRRKHSYELLLIEVDFQHLRPIRFFRVEQRSCQMKDRCAVKDHELTGDPSGFRDRSFVLGNVQKAAAGNHNVERVCAVAQRSCILNIESNRRVFLPSEANKCCGEVTTMVRHRHSSTAQHLGVISAGTADLQESFILEFGNIMEKDIRQGVEHSVGLASPIVSELPLDECSLLRRYSIIHPRTRKLAIDA